MSRGSTGQRQDSLTLKSTSASRPIPSRPSLTETKTLASSTTPRRTKAFLAASTAVSSTTCLAFVTISCARETKAADDSERLAATKCWTRPANSSTACCECSLIQNCCLEHRLPALVGMYSDLDLSRKSGCDGAMMNKKCLLCRAKVYCDSMADRCGL